MTQDAITIEEIQDGQYTIERMQDMDIDEVQGGLDDRNGLLTRRHTSRDRSSMDVTHNDRDRSSQDV